MYRCILLEIIRMHSHRAELFDKDRGCVKYLSFSHYKINAEKYLIVDICIYIERRMCMPVPFVNDYIH